MASAGNFQLPGGAELRDRIDQEFKHDPEVVAVINEIKSATEELDHTKGVAKKGADPARLAVQRHLASLNKAYHELWTIKREEIQKRMLVPTSASGALEPDSLIEISANWTRSRQRKRS